MSDTYKIAVLVAVVIVGGIIGYYLIAGSEDAAPGSDPPDVTTNTGSDAADAPDNARDTPPATPLGRRVTPVAPAPDDSDDAADSSNDADGQPTGSRSALYDLVASYRDESDNTTSGSDGPGDNTPGGDAAADDDANATTTTDDEQGPETLTFDVPADDDTTHTSAGTNSDTTGIDTTGSASGGRASGGTDDGRTSLAELIRQRREAARDESTTTGTTDTTTSDDSADSETTREATLAERTRPPETYTIKPGDTLSSIAVALYGTERRWVDISQANPTIDPTRLRVGQVIKLPGRVELERADRVTQPAPGLVVEYIIRPNDTLSSIAQQYYGNPNQWRYIYNANRDQIENPDILQVGKKIEIPPVPTEAE